MINPAYQKVINRKAFESEGLMLIKQLRELIDRTLIDNSECEYAYTKTNMMRRVDQLESWFAVDGRAGGVEDADIKPLILDSNGYPLPCRDYTDQDIKNIIDITK